MKKILTLVIVVLTVFCIMSCSGQDYVCYYGYFSDTAFAMIYSNQKNTLYYVDIPLDVIVSWGQVNNIDSVPEAIRNFAGLKEAGFMLGMPTVIQSCRDILDAMSDKKQTTVQDRMAVISARSADFAHEPLLSNMSKLCGTDLLPLAKAIVNKKPAVAVLDSSVVIQNNDLNFSRKNFREWIYQVIK